MGRLRNVLVSAFAASLAFAACGPAQTDPYALLDRAWTAGWDRVQIQLGLTLEIPNQGGDVVPLPGNINVDPSAITAIVDTQSRQWRVTLAVPGNALGTTMTGLFSPAFQSVDADVLF